MFGSLASTLGEMNPFRYRGYVYDVETGLYYLRSRYYNPEWGRFINADTVLGKVGALGTHNLFAYCANNPVMMVDPSGHTFLLAALCILVGTLVATYVATQSNSSGNSQASAQSNSTLLPSMDTVNMALFNWWLDLKGVYFAPHSGIGQGGEIYNAAYLTPREMELYLKLLQNEYGDIFQGSIEGFMFEWAVHSCAYYIAVALQIPDLASTALDYDFGATIYSDEHGALSPIMFWAFEQLYPAQSESDFSIHQTLH